MDRIPWKCTSQQKRQTVNEHCLRGISLVMASFAMFLLASCKPSGSTFDTPSPGVASTPVATLVPIASATARDTPTGPAGTLAITPPLQDEVGRYELLELEIQTDIVVNNPFNPDELDIRVDFTSESGKTVDVGAFWYQDFNATGSYRIGKPGWRVRFTPPEIGTWSAVARIPARGLESAPVPFRVLPSDDPGFVRLHPENPRYLAFDNGNFFFPIGINMAWWTATGSALTDYQKWMDPFAANGGNTIRVWMAEWSFGIEWNNTPLGDYTNRLARAYLLDQLFVMAEERDIYVLLVLLNCADFNNWQTSGWSKNPYNAARGGPLEKPEQFVTDPTARTLLQQRLNYIVNRWGYSPHLLAWEWWNEVNLTPFSDAMLIPWLQEMTAYLRARDVNQHLTTNSYAIRDLSPTWDLPELDIIQKHEYAHQVKTTERDLTGRVAADFTKLAASAPPKPILLGEFGYGNEGYGTDIDKSGIHLHNGIWATTFAGYAGSGMYWYWDVYVEAYHVWYQFRGLDQFLDDMDLSRYQPFSPLDISGPGNDPPQARGLGLRGDDILIWLRGEAYTTQAAEGDWLHQGSPQSFDYLPPLVDRQMLTLQDMADGVYTIHWFDPQSGTWLDPVEAITEGGRLMILIPDFRCDLAAKIILNR